jgi:hypothetical protein
MMHMIQPGAPVAPVTIAADRLTVGEITIDYAAEQRDDAVQIVIRHHQGAFSRDSEEGAIVAIVRIPPRQYSEQPVAQPLDTNAVSIELWPFVG